MTQSIFRHRQTGPFFGLAAVAVFVATASLAQAGGYRWNTTTGDWTVGSNWTSTPNQYGPYSAMAVDNNGNATIGPGEVGTDSLASNGGYVLIGDSQGSGMLTMTGGGLETQASSGELFLYVGSGEGFGSATPSGTVIQSGGGVLSRSVISLGGGLNAYGEYDLSAGTITGGGCIMVADDTFGPTGGALGTGLFNQTGGTVGTMTKDGLTPVGLMMAGKWGRFVFDH